MRNFIAHREVALATKIEGKGKNGRELGKARQEAAMPHTMRGYGGDWRVWGSRTRTRHEGRESGNVNEWLDIGAEALTVKADR